MISQTYQGSEKVWYSTIAPNGDVASFGEEGGAYMGESAPGRSHYTVRKILRSAQFKDGGDYTKALQNFKQNEGYWNDKDFSKSTIKSNSEETEDFDNIYLENRENWGRSLGIAPKDLDRLYKTGVGIGLQESNLDNEKDAEGIRDAAGEIYNSLKENVTPTIELAKRGSEKLESMTMSPFEDAPRDKGQQQYNIRFNAKNPSLLPRPSKDKLHIEIKELYNKKYKKLTDLENEEGSLRKYASSAKIPFVNSVKEENLEKAKEEVLSKYKRIENIYNADTTPSVGAFKSKFASESAKNLLGITDGEKNRSNLNSKGTKVNAYYGSRKNQIANVVSTLYDLETQMRRKFPDATKEEIQEKAILSYNAPSKGGSQALWDYYKKGIGNSDEESMGFDYPTKVLDNVKKYYK